MSASQKVISTIEDNISSVRDGQAIGAKAAFAARLLSKIVETGLSHSEIARRSGVSTSALSSYTKGRSFPNSEQLFPLCDVVGAEPRWLVSGEIGKSSTDLVAIDDVDWESVPFFDLKELTDTGKGETHYWTPFRKDWLNRTLGTSFDLYLVRLLSDYRSKLGDRDLIEGDLVFCREITPVELADGYVCIFRRENGLKVARYSLRPRDLTEEDVITANEVADDQFVPVARVLGKLLQRI